MESKQTLTWITSILIGLLLSVTGAIPIISEFSGGTTYTNTNLANQITWSNVSDADSVKITYEQIDDTTSRLISVVDGSQFTSLISENLGGYGDATIVYSDGCSLRAMGQAINMPNGYTQTQEYIHITYTGSTKKFSCSYGDSAENVTTFTGNYTWLYAPVVEGDLILSKGPFYLNSSSEIVFAEYDVKTVDGIKTRLTYAIHGGLSGLDYTFGISSGATYSIVDAPHLVESIDYGDVIKFSDLEYAINITQTSTVLYEHGGSTYLVSPTADAPNSLLVTVLIDLIPIFIVIGLIVSIIGLYHIRRT